MPECPRILILTAAFGDGHNSAARNLAMALEALGAEIKVADPCLLGAPRLTRILAQVYRWVTTRLPRVWLWIYRSAEHCDFGGNTPFYLRGPENATRDVVKEFRPQVVVSTYPLYPYFLAKMAEGKSDFPPVFVVITDSIEINASWLGAPAQGWLVTDVATRDVLIAKGLPAERIHETGFAVHPDFSKLQPIAADDPCDVFRVLYFPTSDLGGMRLRARAVLDASPRVRLTIVLGRNVRQLYPVARELKAAYPGRVKLIGWTRKVPQLLNRHHLVVGKAGGATVHEAIAACCPMLIHHLVPGQEEGNLRLLEKLGGGALASKPQDLLRWMENLLSHDAMAWRAMKRALAEHGKNAGAISAAKIIIES
ncbi:MAG: MGDG synthase family glycosyltransferase [Luteolibacter sp.]